MGIKNRELCPNCVDFTETTEKVEIVREDTNCTVKRVVRFCQHCNQELANTITLKFKSQTG